ncbi:GPW/gp25 family protein [Dyadobacter sandarakinus]|uniref:GPW/gp25 family protein n=1 Tax=Dyadobacter sandarakinus TaxID=2747268 RepID=A0ABX7I423_9BACT|nr:GPW/gp25 family protein [Dyadobacter sandarakinus]QRR00608.1 GPW/gp25 family protein [Dyadobacter sandarakinus]
MENTPLFPSADRKSFLGTGWAFPPQFSLATCAPVMVSDEEDIWQSLQILFSTSLRERRITPDYGCNLEEFVFAPMNVSLLSLLEEMIREGIQLHEARIRLERVAITPNDFEGRLDISVTYIVRSTNTRFNKVYPFYYQEGTNVAF